MHLPRRNFLKGSLLATTGWTLPSRLLARNDVRPKAGGTQQIDGDIIDTNVHLFPWPFRDLKFGDTEKLVRKLRQHRIKQAWAGSFESLLHKDIDGVNRRLMEACGRHVGFLLPFGAVNPAWPDWEEDLRRCHEVYKMPGIRLYPAYQGFSLGDPGFARLLKMAAERKLIVQIMRRMEEGSVHHPKVIAPDVDLAPLAELLRGMPDASIVILNGCIAKEIPPDRRLLEFPRVMFDLADLDGAGGLEKLLRGENRGGAKGKIPADRLVFGSHVPYFPIQNALFKFVESEVREPDLKAILEGNAARLLAGTRGS